MLQNQISKFIRDKERIMAKFNEGFNPDQGKSS